MRPTSLAASSSAAGSGTGFTSLPPGDQPYEIEILGGALDQAQQQQASAIDRDDLDVMTTVCEEVSDRGKSFYERTVVEHPKILPYDLIGTTLWIVWLNLPLGLDLLRHDYKNMFIYERLRWTPLQPGGGQPGIDRVS
jgi:hypothetical protein